jgi:hypothetical protein
MHHACTLSAAQIAMVMVQQTCDQSYGKSYVQPIPFAALCVYLVQFKSTAEAFAKAPANLNDHYTKVANTSDAKKHLTMLQDTLVWQYLPDMVQLLQQKGFHYKTPEVPVLVVRDRH